MKIEHGGVLDDVLPEDCLELSSGEVVGNLWELIGSLESMNDEDFSLHVYGDHNDFAEWFLEAHWNEDLAGKVLGIRNRRKMIKFLKRVLAKAEKERFESGGKGRVLKRIGEME